MLFNGRIILERKDKRFINYNQGDRIFLIITTLKLIVLDVITDTTVSVGLTLSLSDIESVFFLDDKFYLVVDSNNDKIKLLYEMGYKGYDPEKDKKFYKTEAKNKENTFLFIVTLWRMKFINNQSFLRVMKIPNLTYTDVKLKNNNYLFDVKIMKWEVSLEVGSMAYSTNSYFKNADFYVFWDLKWVISSM